MQNAKLWSRIQANVGGLTTSVIQYNNKLDGVHIPEPKNRKQRDSDLTHVISYLIEKMKIKNGRFKCLHISIGSKDLKWTEKVILTYRSIDIKKIL